MSRTRAVRREAPTITAFERHGFAATPAWGIAHFARSTHARVSLNSDPLGRAPMSALAAPVVALKRGRSARLVCACAQASSVREPQERWPASQRPLRATAIAVCAQPVALRVPCLRFASVASMAGRHAWRFVVAAIARAASGILQCGSWYRRGLSHVLAQWGRWRARCLGLTRAWSGPATSGANSPRRSRPSAQARR